MSFVLYLYLVRHTVRSACIVPFLSFFSFIPLSFIAFKQNNSTLQHLLGCRFHNGGYNQPSRDFLMKQMGRTIGIVVALIYPSAIQATPLASSDVID